MDKRNEISIHSEAMKLTGYGCHYMDACHAACALLAGSDYFISTDDRLLNVLRPNITQIVFTNPIDFVRRLGIMI